MLLPTQVLGLLKNETASGTQVVLQERMSPINDAQIWFREDGKDLDGRKFTKLTNVKVD